MEYNVDDAINILSRTPNVLSEMLKGLPESWLKNNEGNDSWSPFDVVGHLVHGEKTDWITRLEIILNDVENKTFQPFDRFAQINDSQGKSIEDLLTEFQQLRDKNIEILKSKAINPTHYNLKGIHPDFGEVTLKELLSVWVAHDLGHIAQISRVMAKQYKDNVGPWKAYLRVVKE